jgi:S-adenosylmethionine:tRNA ribosyltransferase-isomerase
VTSLATDLFNYELPPELIAQTPTTQRDASRLMVINRENGTVEHRHFHDLPDLLSSGDTLIRNNAAVLPARLAARRPTGGAVECFLLRPDSVEDTGELWWCLLKPGKRLPTGATFSNPAGFDARVLKKSSNGTALVEFTAHAPGETVTAIANRLGRMPLPLYIERSTDSEYEASDLERYQTVYANRAKQVAVAAPTAGLHFTPEILEAIKQRQIETVEVTLHVGLGTFRPVKTDLITDHDIHHEFYEMPPATSALLKTPAGRRIAVGTTSVRAIEHHLRQSADIAESHTVASADIFIYPPSRFAGVDGLITNFHQPRSTLLCLVSAFLTPGTTDGIDWIKEIYAEAISEKYRFFSYGDAMLII